MAEKVKNYVRSIFTVDTLKQKVPILKWLPKYKPRDFVSDLIAGITVGLTLIPQGLAYATIANLPPEYGLYSAFMGCFVYCIFGTSKDVSVGPVTIMSLLTAVYAVSPVPGDPTYAIILSLFGGLIELVCGIFHLGFLVSFISYPVVKGFSTAAAITIAFSQVKSLFGFKKFPSAFPQQVVALFQQISTTNGWDFGLGLLLIVMLIVLKVLGRFTTSKSTESKVIRVFRKILWVMVTGRNAIAVLLGAVTAYIWVQHGDCPFTLSQDMAPGFPPFRAPSLSFHNGNITRSTAQVFEEIGVGFAIIPLIGLLEAVAVGKTFARLNKYRVDSNQELIALGLCNIAGSFVSAYPTTGGISRSAVNSQSGVRTPLGNIYSGGLVLLALGVLMPTLRYIPKAALAAVIITAVLQMIDIMIVKHLWIIKKIDLLPLLVTFATSLALSIEYGIMIGTGFSVLLVLYPMARPKSVISGDVVTVVQFNSALLFPAAEYFEDRIERKVFDEGRCQAIVFDMQHVTDVDYTTIQSIKAILSECLRRQIRPLFSNLQHGVLKVLESAKLKGFEVGDQSSVKLDEPADTDEVGIAQL